MSTPGIVPFADGMDELMEISFSVKDAFKGRFPDTPDQAREMLLDNITNASWSLSTITVGKRTVGYTTGSGLSFGWERTSDPAWATFWIAYPGGEFPEGSSLLATAAQAGWRPSWRDPFTDEEKRGLMDRFSERQREDRFDNLPLKRQIAGLPPLLPDEAPEEFDPILYGMTVSFDENGDCIYPEGFDPDANAWKPGYEEQRAAWEADWATAYQRWLDHRAATSGRTEQSDAKGPQS